MKSSGLRRVARELAQYVVWKNHRESKIMEMNGGMEKDFNLQKYFITCVSVRKYPKKKKSL